MAEPLYLGAMVARIWDSENRMGKLLRENGQGGIRTHDTLAGIPVFETGSFSHSDTCPNSAEDNLSSAVVPLALGPRAPAAGLSRARQHPLVCSRSPEC